MPDNVIQPQLAEPGVSLAVARAARRRRAILISAAVLAAFVLWELCHHVRRLHVGCLRPLGPDQHCAHRSLGGSSRSRSRITRRCTVAICSWPIDPEPFQLALRRRAGVAAPGGRPIRSRPGFDSTSYDAQRQVAGAALTYAQQTIRRVQSAGNRQCRVARRNSTRRTKRCAAPPAMSRWRTARLPRRNRCLPRTPPRRRAPRLNSHSHSGASTAPRSSLRPMARSTTSPCASATWHATSDPLIGIVDAHAWRIIANYKQYFIPSFVVGGTAWVWLDSHPWHFYRGRIDGVGRGISRSPEAPDIAALRRAHHRLDPSATTLPGDRSIWSIGHPTCTC